MKRHLVSIGCAAAALLASALPARAANPVFDFENQPIVTETPFGLVNSGYTATFIGAANVDPGAFAISSNFVGPTGFAYQSMSGDFLTIGSAFGASGAALTVTFSAPISGFSVDFGLDDLANANTRRLSFTTNAGATGSAAGALTSGFRYPEGTLSFAGPAFSMLTFQSNAIDFQLDNLRITPAVPEPSSCALLGAGMGAVAFVRRRTARKTAA